MTVTSLLAGVCVCVFACLFGPAESCDRNLGGGVVSMTLEVFASSLPSTAFLSPSRKMKECL